MILVLAGKLMLDSITAAKFNISWNHPHLDNTAEEWHRGEERPTGRVEALQNHVYVLHERPAARTSLSLTQDTTLPLKQGSLALSSEISSLTTLWEQADRCSQGEGHGVSSTTLPLPRALVDTSKRDIHALPVAFSTRLSTGFALLIARMSSMSEQQRWHSQSESPSYCFMMAVRLYGDTKHIDVMRA